MAALLTGLGFERVEAQQRGAAQANRPTYHVTMVPRTILTINYQNRTRTTIGFQGSPLMPLAKGEADVESRGGRIAISADFQGIDSAAKYGPEYLTYVLWAITPEGKANNLGEVLVSDRKSKLDVTTTLQTFGLIVTAEPYYAVSQPSDAVVLENIVAPGTAGTLQPVDVNYQLFSKGFYSYTPSTAPSEKLKAPLELEEARNAVSIAENAEAPQYAPEPFNRAQQSLQNAEATLRHGDKKVVVQDARDAVQNAAEAMQTTVSRREQEALDQERAAQQQQTAQAQAEAAAAAAKQQQEAAARQEAELQREKAELQAQQASQQAQEAALEAQQAAQARAAAEAKAQQDAEAAAQAQQAAQQARMAAQQAEAQREQLRAMLLAQFNRVLPTTDTPRGLQANLADVLFATGKFDLQPPAREALAKFSGIVLAHPGLKMQVEGYTDSVGSDTFNQTLSENRANSVRAYLIGQGIDPTAVSAVGYGKSNPVASNDTSDGRQQNRRVEIIISGEIIGTQIGQQIPDASGQMPPAQNMNAQPQYPPQPGGQAPGMQAPQQTQTPGQPQPAQPMQRPQQPIPQQPGQNQ
jgi:outer membrane protein OmpA-like peptidoglycan-associated protein